VNDAYKQRYEKAYLVTRDSDLMPAVRMIRAEFPTKQIVAVAPPLMGHSNDLITVCHSKQKISPDHACYLRNSSTATGHSLFVLSNTVRSPFLFTFAAPDKASLPVA
jgi:hypothetical protein